MGAVGLLGMTNFSSVPNEPVVRLRPFFLGDDLHEPLFHLFGRFPDGKPRSVRNAEHVRIDGDRIPAEGDRINDVGRLSPHAREALQFFQTIGNLSAEFLDNIARGGENVSRLVAIKSAGEDVLFELFLREREHAFGGIVLLKEHFRHFIDPFVRALCGKDDRYQKFVWGLVQERRLGAEIEPFELPQNFRISVHACIIPYLRPFGKRLTNIRTVLRLRA